MNIDKVISISGKPGLFTLVTQSSNGFIAENLDSNKKTSVPASANVSLLNNIAIYTETEEVPLVEVFQKIFDKENGGQAINHKSSENELRAYMEEILPEYDKDRVYKSDLKKLFQWYNILQRNDMLISEEKEETKETVQEEE